MRYLYYIVILSITINSYSNELSNEQYVLNKKIIDSLDQKESEYPNFLTKEYYNLDKKNIISSNDNLNKLYKINSTNIENNQLLFDGLESSGSISRGFNIGNNQNTTLNSELDLQISGKLSEKVYLKASIQDAGIPLQDNGYSQRLDEFDQIFIEVYSDQWRIRAGDIDLKNKTSYFGKFQKRIQGLYFNSKINSNSRIFGSGAIVKGQFKSSSFLGEDGNQGPYKLIGSRGELYVLVVSGSESVFVNGSKLERGIDKDYTINYNAGEIIFNTTMPITSDMRININYQVSDRNYSRFVSYSGVEIDKEKIQLNVSFFNENDLKNQSLQQNLSDEQISILSQAGDDNSLMTAPSAYQDSFSENRILYRKEIVNGTDIFVYSNNPDEELYSVKFTNVGNNQGNYILQTNNAIDNIYEYIPPSNGIKQGNYDPIIKLVSPEKLQIAVINGNYTPNEKTNVKFEIASSKSDKNLFSNIDDNNNDGLATKFSLSNQIVKSKLWDIYVKGNLEYIDKNFQSVEMIYNPEFNRDWNLDSLVSYSYINQNKNQLLLKTGINLINKNIGEINYNYENLKFEKQYDGTRQLLDMNLKTKGIEYISNSSILNSESSLYESEFLRSYNTLKINYKKGWSKINFEAEKNLKTNLIDNRLAYSNHAYKSYELATGIGDIKNKYVEIGYKKRINDSVISNRLQKVNSSNNYYLKSQILKDANSNLNMFINYREMKREDDQNIDKYLNSRLIYNQKLFDQIVQSNMLYETNSGNLPQQEYTYVEVEPGLGSYKWIDINNNGIQELEEFELAQFQDEGLYIRVFLPNQIYINTYQNRFSQSLIVNFHKWSNSEKKFRKILSHFSNQSQYIIDKKTNQDIESFNFNPFYIPVNGLLGLITNFKNSLHYNRGKQDFSTTYSYSLNKSKNTLSFGYIENNLASNQLNFTHKLNTNWLIDINSIKENKESVSENFDGKNYNLEQLKVHPKMTYIFNESNRLNFYYQYSTNQNTIGNLESLKQQKIGISSSISNSEKINFSCEFNYINNSFEGNPNSIIGYVIMEGLQAGSNYTWSLTAQRKLTKSLDLNFSYFGRKSENSNSIHNGNIQLRAIF